MKTPIIVMHTIPLHPFSTAQHWMTKPVAQRFVRSVIRSAARCVLLMLPRAEIDTRRVYSERGLAQCLTLVTAPHRELETD